MKSANWLLNLFRLLVLMTGLILMPFSFFQLNGFLSMGDDFSEYRVAIVFGASVTRSRRPSFVLAQRLEAAIELYKAGEIEIILVSGDNREESYNEPLVMRQYLIDRQIPSESIVSDFGGRRTIDTCYRAANIFKVQKAVLVSQPFHLGRANFLCQNQGIKTIPVMSGNADRDVTVYGAFREVPASWLALLESLTGYQSEVGSDGTEVQIEG